MNALSILAGRCPPPASPDFPESTNLFGKFRLSVPPPEELEALYRTYGLGRFTCDSNAITLLNPKTAGPDVLGDLVNVAHIVADHHPKLASLLLNGSPIPTNIIVWGYDDNGVILTSAHLSDVLGWCVIAMRESALGIVCYLQSAPEVLLDCISGMLPGEMPVWGRNTRFEKCA